MYMRTFTALHFLGQEAQEIDDTPCINKHQTQSLLSEIWNQRLKEK